MIVQIHSVVVRRASCELSSWCVYKIHYGNSWIINNLLDNQAYSTVVYLYSSIVRTSYFYNTRLSGFWWTIYWMSAWSNGDGTRLYKNFVGNNLYYSPSSSSSSSCLTATWFSSRRTCRLQRAIVDDTDLAETETFASRVMIDSKALSRMKLFKRPHPIGVRHLLAWTFICILIELKSAQVDTSLATQSWVNISW